MDTFTNLESEVRGYCRSFPVVFQSASGHTLTDTDGRRYIDFFSGAGALNYGHNPPHIKEALLAYLQSDALVHGLDMMTTAKRRFLERFSEVILKPRDLDYKVQFPGPTGTNAVEAALKLARKVTGRTSVLAFTNGFHGMTLGSLAATGNRSKRAGAGIPLGHVTSVPFDGFLGADVDTTDYLEAMLAGSSSGLDLPAAILVETVQAEGGLNVASRTWLRRLALLARRFGALLIVDDIQAGCGRAGSFFSFEEAGITPDIVLLSKSLSGYGLPLSVVLMKRELDIWSPGEHNGTFRGFNPAFVTATAALDFWTTDELVDGIAARSGTVRDCLRQLADGPLRGQAHVRGRGLMLGLSCDDPAIAQRIARRAFERGVILETAGAEDQVVKIMPPLNIPEDGLALGLELLSRAVSEAVEAVRREVSASNGAVAS